MKTHKLAIVITTYRDDLGLFSRLINSITRYNVESIPVVVVCPSDCLEEVERIAPFVIAIDENEMLVERAPHEGHRGLSRGYVTQQLVNLSVFNLKIAENYLVICSDSLFIRDFGHSDFFDDEWNLYTVLSTEKELIIDPSYRTYAIPRNAELRMIYHRVNGQKSNGADEARLLQVQMNPLISSKVMADLLFRGFPTLGLTAVKALEISPFEYGWYNAWLLREKIIPIIQIEPLFKTFHTRDQYIWSQVSGLTHADIANGYIGVVYNSNWYKRYENETIWEKVKLDFRSDHYYFKYIKLLVRSMKRLFLPRKMFK